MGHVSPRTTPIAVVELSSIEAASVLRGALASFPAMIRNYFDATPDSPKLLGSSRNSVASRPPRQLVRRTFSVIRKFNWNLAQI
jgi:hypothetical protein